MKKPMGIAQRLDLAERKAAIFATRLELINAPAYVAAVRECREIERECTTAWKMNEQAARELLRERRTA